MVSAANLLSIAFFALLPVSSHAESRTPTAELIEAIGTFSYELHRHVADDGGNVCLSPYGVAHDLGALALGARAGTAREIRNVLRYDMDEKKLPAAFRGLDTALKARAGDAELRSSRRLLIDRSITPRERFVSLLRRIYQAEIEPEDMRSAEQVGTAVTRWMNRKSRERSEAAYDTSSLPLGPSILAADTLSFRARWEVPFEREGTANADFHVNPQHAVDVKMMKLQAPLNYSENSQAQLVELPFQGYGFSLILIVPKRSDGLAHIEQTITKEKADTWLGTMAARTVELSLPRFRVRSRPSLRETVADMGIAAAFRPAEADFGAIDPDRPVFVSDIVHHAVFSIDEAGADISGAAAAKGSTVKKKPAARFVRADHPFMFLVMENKSQTIILTGRIVDPSQEIAAAAEAIPADEPAMEPAATPAAEPGPPQPALPDLSGR